MPTAIGNPPLGLDIDMEQLTWPLALVAHDLPGRPVQLPQPGQPMAGQHRMHRGGGLAKRPTDPVGTDPVCVAPGQDRLLPRGRQPTRAPVGPTRPVSQAGVALGPPTAKPFVGRGHRHPLGFGGPGHRPSLSHDPLDQQPPTQHRQLRSTMHPESLLAEFLDSPQPGGSHHLHNLSGNHS
jgi:hypothetical protein